MRNWNSACTSGYAQQPELPDYLWGIETAMSFWTLIEESRFQTTYEELKRRSTRERYKHNSASRLPMRNWNHPRSSFPFARLPGFQTTYEELKLLSSITSWGMTTLASRLPMRNWNVSLWNSLRIPDSFQTTYEELKLMTPRTIATTTSFQTTYEELKLVLLVWFSFGLGFQTTYEELKLDERHHFFWEISALPDYLWGIETDIRKSTFIYGFASRLPMRNWNCYDVSVPSNTDTSFQTTYEELKLRGYISTAKAIDNASRLPMRNWNPCSFSGIQNKLKLPDYLWGIETLFLGGWKI